MTNEEIKLIDLNNLSEFYGGVREYVSNIRTKKMIVDDISEFLYDLQPKSLDSYGFDAKDVEDFLNGDLDVDVQVNYISTLFKLVYPGLYSVWNELISDVFKYFVLNHSPKIKFSTRQGSFLPGCDLQTILSTMSNIPHPDPSDLPDVKCADAAKSQYIQFFASSAALAPVIPVSVYFIELMFLQYLGYEPIRFFASDYYFDLLDKMNLTTGDDGGLSQISPVVIVSDNQLGVLGVNISVGKKVLNPFIDNLLQDIFKDVPRDSNYDFKSAFLACLDYFNDTDTDRMNEYCVSQGTSNYLEFRNIIETLLNQMSESSLLALPAGLKNIYDSFLKVLQSNYSWDSSRVSNDPYDFYYQEGYDAAVNDQTLNSTSNPYESGTTENDYWSRGYSDGWSSKQQ